MATDSPIPEPFELRKLVSWDELHARALSHQDLTADERMAAAASVLQLQFFLGDQVLEGRHPLVFFFLNHAAGPLKWAIWLGDFLSAIRNYPDFEQLVEDLRDPSRIGERLTILNIAEMLWRAGFTFALDKAIELNGAPKKPDLFVQLDSKDPGFFIEICALGQSEKEREANQVFHTLANPLNYSFGSFEHAGKVERVLSPKHLAEVLDKVRAAQTRVENESDFEAVVIDGVLKLAIAKKAGRVQLDNWAQAHGLQVGEFRGPSVEVSEMDRVSAKLKKEQEQLPRDRSNVVVIYPHLFLNTPYSPETFHELAHSIEDALYRHSHIGYLVLVFTWMGGNSKESYRLRDHYCINRERFDFRCETFMLFKNRFADKPLPDVVERRFLQAFLNECPPSST